MNNQRLGYILLQQGCINAQQLDFGLKVQSNNGGERIGRVLKHYDFISEGHIIQALAQQMGWKVYEGDYCMDSELLDILGQEFCMQNLVLPVMQNGIPICVLIKTDDMATTDYIQSKFNRRVEFCLGCETGVRKALEQLKDGQLDEGLRKCNQKSSDDILGWFEKTIEEALFREATDIHIEPSVKAVEIRVRVDGVLYCVDTLRLNQLPKLVNIIFHKADVTISDFNHFHDARFSYAYLNRTIDVRVSHIPSIHGSSIVVRLLDKTKSAIDLTDLGYRQTQWDLMKSNLVDPQGLSLIIGPTGCGKTTTLYAILNYLKSISQKIVTIEDPVEMHLSLMTQVQTQEKRGVSFASAVRAFLRHDPNIILIGEIRDAQTAQEAIRAAMTGHKVFATLHANRPVDAVLRLNDLGVPFTHMAGNLRMIVTQRLLRKLCPLCKQLCKTKRSSLASYEQKYLKNEDARYFCAVGCDACVEGYKQRTIVSEVMTFDDDLELNLGQGRVGELRQKLRNRDGYRTMLDDACQLIEEGEIDLKEALRVLG